MDPQNHFDDLVRVAEAWLQSSGFSQEERALEEQLELARQRDEGVANAAVDLAFRKLAPDLSWNARGGE